MPTAKTFTLLLILLFGVPPMLFAEVFLLGSPRKRGVPMSAELPGLNPQPLLTEEVIVNGKAMELNVFQMKATLEQTALILKNRFAPLKMSAGKRFIRAIFEGGKNKTLRYLFVSAGNDQPLTVFQLELPGNLPAPVWNRRLPELPDGAVADFVMEMPSRNAVYGSFGGGNGNPADWLVSCAAQLKSRSWQAAGAESGANIRGSGDIFIRSKPHREIMWVQFGKYGDGAFYHKILQK